MTQTEAKRSPCAPPQSYFSLSHTCGPTSCTRRSLIFSLMVLSYDCNIAPAMTCARKIDLSSRCFIRHCVAMFFLCHTLTLCWAAIFPLASAMFLACGFLAQCWTLRQPMHWGDMTMIAANGLSGLVGIDPPNQKVNFPLPPLPSHVGGFARFLIENAKS